MVSHAKLTKTMGWLLLALIILGCFCAFYFHGYTCLRYPVLKQYHDLLRLWSIQHYGTAVLLFLLIYLAAVMTSLPGARSILTLAGGYLFGPAIGTLCAITSTTVGSGLTYFAIRSTTGDWWASKTRGRIARMEKEFRENTFRYVLSLRLIPIFPFGVVNIVSALAEAPFVTFIAATVAGSLPGLLVYAMIGSHLNLIFQNDQAATMNTMLQPTVTLPLMGLAILPILAQLWKKSR